MHRNLSFVILFILFVSCNNRKYDLSFHEKCLNKDVLDSSKVLVVDSIIYDSIFASSKGILVFDDSLFVVKKRNISKASLIDIITKNKKKLISLFKYGNGNHELLSADISIRDRYLVVNDIIRSQFINICMDSLLHNSSYIPQIIKYETQGITGVEIDEDGYIVYVNPFFFHEEELNINQGKHRLISTRKNEDESNFEYKYDTWNVGGDGILIANIDKNKFMYASKNFSVLELYDKFLNLKTRVTGPISLHPNYSLIPLKEEDDIQVTFKDKIPYSYLDCCSDSYYVYFLYIGDFLSDSHGVEDFKSYILKYDWDCNLINTYIYDGFLYTISKGEQDNVFYSTFEREDGNMSLLKLKCK